MPDALQAAKGGESLDELLGGLPEMVAETTVATPAERLFERLSDLETHWRLGGARVEVISLEGPAGARTGGRVRLRGPLGISRVARTRVGGARRPRWITGSAELNSRTVGRVAWLLEPAADGTHLRLGARVERAGPLDRLLLVLGGRRWLRRMLAATLEGLAQEEQRDQA